MSVWIALGVVVIPMQHTHSFVPKRTGTNVYGTGIYCGQQPFAAWAISSVIPSELGSLCITSLIHICIMVETDCSFRHFMPFYYATLTRS